VNITVPACWSLQHEIELTKKHQGFEAYYNYNKMNNELSGAKTDSVFS